DEPFVAFAGANPDGVSVETHFIVARHGRLELVKLGFDWFVSAGHHADSLQLAFVGVGAGDGGFAFAHFGLSLEPKHREGGAFWRSIKLVEFHRPGVTALVAGVITLDL